MDRLAFLRPARWRTKYLKVFLCFLATGSLFLFRSLHEDSTDWRKHYENEAEGSSLYSSGVTFHRQYVNQQQRIANSVQEFWNYVQAQLETLKEEQIKREKERKGVVAISEVGSVAKPSDGVGKRLFKLNDSGVKLKNPVEKSSNTLDKSKETGAKAMQPVGAPSEHVAKLQRILDMTSEFKGSILSDLKELMSIQGGDKWVASQNQRLGNLVQERLKRIQNPTDCASRPKVLCTVNLICGFGCQLHHITLCLIIAYGTNRTLVMKSKGWKYNGNGWEDLFLPLSDTCRTIQPGAKPTRLLPPYNTTADVITVELLDITYDHWVTPRSLPPDIAASLVHGEPVVWWVGQFVRYIFRPNSRLRQILSHHSTQIFFQHPVVGVHIRRTDKIGREADVHRVEEYMTHVEEYYDQLELKQEVVRRVYIATDDKRVIDEIERKYPQYTILGDPIIAANALKDSRYTTAGLLGIISDLHFLSKSDYLVCTFSSQICRLAYELRNAEGPKDYSQEYKSLDDIWFFAGGTPHMQVALLPHHPQTAEEISLAMGDELLPYGNHWDGYCKGKNMRTGQTGLYPAFKVKSLPETFEGFPSYADDT